MKTPTLCKEKCALDREGQKRDGLRLPGLLPLDNMGLLCLPIFKEVAT
jgi:hypothetical protein